MLTRQSCHKLQVRLRIGGYASQFYNSAGPSKHLRDGRLDDGGLLYGLHKLRLSKTKPQTNKQPLLHGEQDPCKRISWGLVCVQQLGKKSILAIKKSKHIKADPLRHAA